MKSTVSTGLRPHDRLAAAGKRSQVRACAERSATAERSSHSSRSCRRGSAAGHSPGRAPFLRSFSRLTMPASSSR